MHKAVISSKGQLTIPKDIREHLQLETGSEVSFRILKSLSGVLLEKVAVYEKCPLCLGLGTFEDQTPCFCCDNTGQIEANMPIEQLVWEIMSNARKYNIAVHLQSFTGIREIKLLSTTYPNHLLNDAQEYLQTRFIEKMVNTMSSDHDELTIFSESVIDEIEAMFTSRAAKAHIRELLTGKSVYYDKRTPEEL